MLSEIGRSKQLQNIVVHFADFMISQFHLAHCSPQTGMYHLKYHATRHDIVYPKDLNVFGLVYFCCFEQ